MSKNILLGDLLWQEVANGFDEAVAKGLIEVIGDSDE